MSYTTTRNESSPNIATNLLKMSQGLEKHMVLTRSVVPVPFMVNVEVDKSVIVILQDGADRTVAAVRYKLNGF